MTTFQKDVEKAEFLLRQGLFEDEKGRPMNALPLYTDAVDLCLATVSNGNLVGLITAFEFVIHVRSLHPSTVYTVHVALALLR